MAITEPQAVMPQAVITNQRGEVVMPGHAVIALPSRDTGPSPPALRARNQP